MQKIECGKGNCYNYKKSLLPLWREVFKWVKMNRGFIIYDVGHMGNHLRSLIEDT